MFIGRLYYAKLTR